MSKHRTVGDIVSVRLPSAFLGPDLQRVRVQLNGVPGEYGSCLRGDCYDRMCREWDESTLLDGPYTGSWVSHLSECEMEDA